jgi:hypothetical protein
MPCVILPEAGQAACPRHQEAGRDGPADAGGIVRTCVEACGGTVTCRNREPSGLEVAIRLEPPRDKEVLK